MTLAIFFNELKSRVLFTSGGMVFVRTAGPLIAKYGCAEHILNQTIVPLSARITLRAHSCFRSYQATYPKSLARCNNWKIFAATAFS